MKKLKSELRIRKSVAYLMVGVLAAGGTMVAATPALAASPGTYTVSVKEGIAPIAGVVVKACYNTASNTYECVDSSESSGNPSVSTFSIPSLPTDYTGFINLSAGGFPTAFSEAFSSVYVLNGQVEATPEIIVERTEWIETTISVKDSSNRGVQNRQVFLSMPEDGWTRTIWSEPTNASGETTLNLDKNIWSRAGVVVTAYVEESFGLYSAASQIVTIDLSAKTGFAQLNVTQLYVPGVYNITVRNSSGELLPDVPVRSYYACSGGGWDCGQTVLTNSAGIATFTNISLLNSTGHINFSAGGHPTAFSQAWSGTYIVNGVLQWPPQELSLQAATWLETEVTVINTGRSPNLPVRNVSVKISTPEQWGPRTEWATTDSSGVATFYLDSSIWGGSKVVTAELESWSGYQQRTAVVTFSDTTGTASINTKSLSYNLSGTVLDFDGNAFTSRQMCLSFSDGSRFRQVDTTTNSSGRYSVDGVAGNWVSFRPSSCNSWEEGYDSSSFSFRPDSGASDTDPVHNFQFTRTGIELTVTHSDGLPAAHLQVQLNDGSQWPRTSTTDQFGVAFFGNLNNQPYTAAYNHGQNNWTTPRFENKQSTETLTIGAINTVTQGTLELTQVPGAIETPVSISGRLVTVNGLPVANGSVALWSGNGVSARVRSDSEGEFSISNLPHGWKSLTISANGFRNTNSNVSTSSAVGNNYDLGDFQLRTVVNGNFTYSGILRNTKGEPIPDMELKMDAPWGSGQARKTVTTNSSGAFSFEGLTAGWHGIYADGWYEDYEWKYWSFNLTGTTPNVALTLSGREVISQNSIAAISGTVLEYKDSDGPGSAVAVANACIWAWPTNGGRSHNTNTDAAGNWSISGLVEGQQYHYNLQNSCAGNDNNLNRFDYVNKYEYPTYNSTIVATANGGIPGEIFLVEISRTGSGSISGRVKDSIDYSNLSGIPVSIFRARGGIQLDPVITDARGEYSFPDLPAGDYYLQIGEYSDDPEALHEAAWISVEVGTEANRVNALLNRLSSSIFEGQLSGQVFDEFGLAHGSGSVNITDAENYTNYGYAFTDNLGRFEISGLPVGVMLQMRITPQWKELAEFFSQIMITAGNSFVVLNRVDLREAATISGSVTGLPFSENGSGVNLFAELIDKSTQRVIQTTWIDGSTGRYGFEQVPQGTFLLRFTQNPEEYAAGGDGDFQFGGSNAEVTSVKPVYWNRTQFGTTNELAASELEIEPGDTRRAINIAISPGSFLVGELSVITPDGASLLSGTRQVAVTVHMKRPNGTWFPVTTSGVSGQTRSTFLIAGLSDGIYKLEFQDLRRGNNSLTTSYNGGFSSLEQAPEIVVGEGQRVVVNHSMTIAPPERSAEAFDLDDLGAETLAGLRDEITLDAEASLGSEIEIFVGTEFAGEFVSAFANSTPIVLGDWKQVNSRGFITVEIPISIPTGSHRIAVQDSRSVVFGWAPISISGPEPVTENPTANPAANPAASSATKPVGSVSKTVISPRSSSDDNDSQPETIDQEPSITEEALVAPSGREPTGNDWLLPLAAGFLLFLVAGSAWLVRQRRRA